MKEETLNHFLSNTMIDHIRLFLKDGGMQLWLENGSFMTIYARGEKLDIDLHGPEAPEAQQLQDSWDAEVENG